MVDKSDKKSKKESGCPKKEKKKESGNGKGDTPRNLSSKFTENYDKINWKKEK